MKPEKYKRHGVILGILFHLAGRTVPFCDMIFLRVLPIDDSSRRSGDLGNQPIMLLHRLDVVIDPDRDITFAGNRDRADLDIVHWLLARCLRDKLDNVAH